MSAWLDVEAGLVALLPTLTGWTGVRVFDGPPVTSDAPPRYCTVGYVRDEEYAGSFETEPRGNDSRVVEIGGVRSEIVTVSGDTDVTVVRAQGFALLAELEAYLKDNPRMGGVLVPGSTTRLVVDVLPLQTTAGALQRLPFTVAYTTYT